jgi:copper chaperone
MMERTYRVAGMTCEHCVIAVRGELDRVIGVTGVDVDLPAGLVVVSAEGALDDAAVREAVEEAGFELAT